MWRFYRATLKPSDVFTVASERELLVKEFRILSMKSENRLKYFSHFYFYFGNLMVECVRARV